MHAGNIHVSGVNKAENHPTCTREDDETHHTHIKHKACTLGLIILKYSSADLLLIVIETVFTDTYLQGESLGFEMI